MNLHRNRLLLAELILGFLCWHCGAGQTSSDQIQRILSAAQSMKYREITGQTERVEPSGGKCGFWISFEAARHWKEFSAVQRKQFHALMQPDPTQNDTVIGHFHIFYDTTGFAEPALLDNSGNRIPNTAQAYVDSVGRIFNDVWNYEIDLLGYSAPPFKQGQSTYSIYVRELGTRLYGQTIFGDSDQIGGSNQPPRYTSYIEVDNDYLGFYSRGLSGLKVTAAHEFHHAIQIGSYGFWGDDRYFYEITSTWMENVVYHDVSDYLQYLSNNPDRSSQFAHPEIAFTTLDGSIEYSRAIWGKYVAKRFGRDVMRTTWTYIVGERPLIAMDHALNNVGSKFQEAFVEWSVWNSMAGPDCDTAKYYSEGQMFPTMLFQPMIDFVKLSTSPASFTDNVQAISSSYHPICILNTPADACDATHKKVLVVVSNLNMAAAYGSTQYTFTYRLAGSNSGSFARLEDGVYGRLEVPDPANWSAPGIVPSVVQDVFVYPDPFSPGAPRRVSFRLPPVTQPVATLYVFSSRMEEIVSKELNVISMTFEPMIQWDGRNRRGDLIGTGIYVFVITVDDMQYTGKFAVVKE